MKLVNNKVWRENYSNIDFRNRVDGGVWDNVAEQLIDSLWGVLVGRLFNHVADHLRQSI